MNTNDSKARLADMQAHGLEDAFALGRAATGMFERLARQNYAVVGDVVDYTLGQIRIPTSHTDPRAVLEAQVAGTRRLAEKARVRADEYAAIAGEMSGMVGGAMKRAASNTAGVAAARADTTAPAPAAKAEAANVSVPAAPAPAPVAPPRDVSRQDAPKQEVSKRAGSKRRAADVGGSPIVLPSDSPKAAASKTAAAKPATRKPVARKLAGGKPADGKLVTKASAAKAKPAAKTRPAARRTAAKKTSGRGAKG